MAEALTTRYYPGMLIARVINLIVGVIEFMLGVRIILELFGASPAAPFIAWVYAVTSGLLGPFVGAFPNVMFGGSVVDVVAILAMIVYAVIGWLVIRVVSYIFAGV